MEDDPDPIPVGTKGTIRGSSEHGFGRNLWHQIDVEWDNGRQLMLVTPPDCFEILTTSERDKEG
jgi:hypothetical protein